MLINNDEYLELFHKIIDCIKTSQYKVVVDANLTLLHRNWRIGTFINENNNWGTKFLDNLSKDIKSEFPDSTGYSVRNLRDMKKFASIFEEDDIDEYGLAGITWYHHKALMGKAKTKEAYIWYAEKTIQNGWSHNTLKCNWIMIYIPDKLRLLSCKILMGYCQVNRVNLLYRQ